MQKCQVDLERLQETHSKLSGLEAEKKDLQAALDASNEKLEEEVARNIGLVYELDTAMAEIYRLKAETEVQEKRVAELKASLEKQKAELEANLQAETDAAFNEGVA